MLTFAIYDISENRSRSSLIKLLRHHGFYRIQKSVFAGDITLDERLDLIDNVEMYLSSERDSIIVVPICESCKDSIVICSEYKLTLPHNLEFKLL
ncbi:MAG: CRISPR-associated endonuclease Cas2 [Methanobrevibacter sp.]|nr:CRISPR-associated endonuclease Cas2 [Candidatus Methanovirga australis]